MIAACAAAFGVAADDTHWLPCADVVDDVERLGCYDGVARSRRERALHADAESFGSRARAEAPVAEITSRIVHVAVSARGQQTVTLENGQIWRENEPGRARLSVDDTVVLRQALLRYSMQTEAGLRIPVHRIE